MCIVPFTSLGGMLCPINCTLFSRRTNLVPSVTPSEQVMVRLFPSTTVTAPTGSMVTVWASEIPNTPKCKLPVKRQVNLQCSYVHKGALKSGVKYTYTERTKKNERRFHCAFPVRLSLALVL